jgi:flagellar hook-basal body complex protein FliE
MDVKTIAGGITRPLEVPGLQPPAAQPAPGEASSFGKLLKDSLAQVDQLQHEADGAIESLATGGTATLHDTMLAVQKAELSFKLMMQVRNKIVEAYQEVVRMGV